MKWKKWLSFALTLLLTVALFPLSAAAAGEKTLLILGDSISTGYGLESYVAGETPPAAAFPVLLTTEGYAFEGYKPIYKARDGLKANELLALLQAKEDTEGYRTAIAQADVITLTIGGNDLMNLLYTTVTKAADPTPEETTEAEVAIIRAAIESGHTGVLALAAAIINNGGFEPENPWMQAELAAIVENFQAVAAAIRELNPKAALIVSTQYNPYEKLASVLTSFQSISLAKAIVRLSADMDGTLAAFAQSIVDGQMQDGKELYKVADLYKTFQQSEANLCNPKMMFSPFSINLDFHPNADGHRTFAAAFGHAYKHVHSYTKTKDTAEPMVVKEVCACGYTKNAVPS